MTSVVWLFVLSMLIFLPPTTHAQAITHSQRLALREEVRAMFYHAYEGYLDNAFPADELMPQSCKGRWRFPNRHPEHRGTLDEGFGNYSLTLIDALDTLVVMGDLIEFQRAVGLVTSFVDFDQDITVNVFETTIRTLGGLISAHLLAERFLYGDNCTNLHLKAFPLSPSNDGCSGYKYGEKPLLDLAQSLADRLLPAFDTPTGIPYARVNLRNGVPKYEKTETCLAGAGTLLLEFGTLSRLTGDPTYEEVADRALHSLWARREPNTNLVGALIDVKSGKWLQSSAGIGAGCDSFYEYLLKSYVIFGKPSYLHMFNESYTAIQRYMKQGDWHFNVHMATGFVIEQKVDSLQAFFPGVQVLNGDISGAVETYSAFHSLWTRYGSLPETYYVKSGHPPRHVYRGYPLRPEFIESTLMLYDATKDPLYLKVGEQILNDLKRTRTECGFAAVADVETGRLEDRMDSYFLAETCKYLFLLFDEENEFLRTPGFIFSTEGHILPIFDASTPSPLKPPHAIGSKSVRRGEMQPPRKLENEERLERPGTCKAPDMSILQKSLDSKMVLSTMFAEHLMRQRDANVHKANATTHEDSEYSKNEETETRESDPSNSRHRRGPLTIGVQPDIKDIISISMWGTPVTVLSVSGVELYPENLFLTLADEPPSAFDEEGQVANVSVNSQVDDRNTQEEGDGVYTEEGDGVYTEEDEGNPKEEGLRVVAVQALFGPFFSMFIERPFNLIYVPHEMCPDQDLRLDPNDLFGRVALIPRGRCLFAEKAKTLLLLRASGMLLYNTNPQEPALEMTAAHMDIPLPSAMVNYTDGMTLKRALAKNPFGMLRIQAHAIELPDHYDPSQSVDIPGLRKFLEDYVAQQHKCVDEACLRFIDPMVPFMVVERLIPRLPKEDSVSENVEAFQPNHAEMATRRPAEKELGEEDEKEAKSRQGDEMCRDQKVREGAGLSSATAIEFKMHREEMRSLFREREQMEAALDKT